MWQQLLESYPLMYSLLIRCCGMILKLALIIITKVVDWGKEKWHTIPTTKIPKFFYLKFTKCKLLNVCAPTTQILATPPEICERVLVDGTPKGIEHTTPQMQPLLNCPLMSHRWHLLHRKRQKFIRQLPLQSPFYTIIFCVN
jgi:hypothetical protein